MSLHDEMISMGVKAVHASRELAKLSTKKKNAILEAMADEIGLQKEAIKAANAKDLDAGREAGLSAALLDRLTLTDARIDGMIKGLREVAALKDPVGKKLSTIQRPNGLQIKKIRVPIGVIAIIFESRPNVTAEAASLCFKTANAVILRGGKEAVYSNAAIAKALRDGGLKKGMPADAIQLVETTDRDAVRELAQMVGKIDLIMPRGGESLIKAVTEMAWVPVIKHYKGVCHTYVDAKADIDMALAIAENAKCQRPGVCNAMETLLVHKDIVAAFLPRMIARFNQLGVELRGDDEMQKALPRRSGIVEITLRDGRKLRHHTPDVRGTPANPMTRAEVDEKCFLLCAPIVGKRRARELIDAVWNIEKLRNVRALRQWLTV